MATNTLLTIQMITNEALRVLENNLAFAKGVNRQYDDAYGRSGAKIGTVLNVRKPVKYVGTVGAALNVENSTETSVPVVLNTQFHVGMEFSSQDLALSIDDFSDRFIKPAVARIANKIDEDGLALVKKIPNTVGKAGELADDLKTFLAAGAKLDNEATPRDDSRAIVVDPYTQAGLVDNLKGLFNDVTEVARQYREGTMGRTAGFKWSMDQNVVTHVFGSGVQETDLTVAGAGQSGASLTIGGLTGNLKAGDTFTIDGVFAVNPQSFQSTGKLRQFVVLADVANAGTVLSISPAIVATGPYQNVTALPANLAVITFIGTANASVKLGVAHHKDAFTLACADLPLPDGTDQAARVSDSQLGLSIRMIRDYIPTSDQFVTRLDVLYGWAVLRPELAVKIISDSSAFTE